MSDDDFLLGINNGMWAVQFGFQAWLMGRLGRESNSKSFYGRQKLPGGRLTQDFPA